MAQRPHKGERYGSAAMEAVVDSCRQQSRGPRATAGHDHLDQEARRSHGEGAIGEPGTGDSAPLVTVGGS